MVYKVLLLLAVALETAFVPVFLKEQRYKKTNRSLAVKMICATLFMFVAVMAIHISQTRSEFVKLLMIALSLGWVGDLFLHLRGGAKTYAVGGTAFFLGHLVYAYTFIKICISLEEGWTFLVLWRIMAVGLLVMATIIVIAINYKKLIKWMMLPCILYATMLSTMAICSVSVAVATAGTENENFGILLAFGAVLFTISDATIGILDYGKVKSFPLKCVNIGTYFAGQTAIAASMAFLFV